MKYFIFIFKTTGISLFTSALLGYLVGLIWGMNSVPHPHQMFPEWVLTVFVAVCTSLVAGTIIGSVLSALNKTNLVHSTLYTVGFVVVVLAFFLFPLV
jgi:hypothetical protein